MADHWMDLSDTGNQERSSTPENGSSGQSSPDLFLSNLRYSEMNLQVLASHCMREFNNYLQGEPYSNGYVAELLLRATVHGDQEARLWVRHCFEEVVFNWLRLHPRLVAGCHPESVDNLVIQAFERFWLATKTTSTHRMECSTFASAMQYLSTSIVAVILDTLRRYSWPGEISLLDAGESVELCGEVETYGSEVWRIVKTLLPNPREQRLAYLLFHCGLKPEEIVRFCPQEFNDIRVIHRLRNAIIERLLRNAHLLRERLS
jgi:hypothetical protein